MAYPLGLSYGDKAPTPSGIEHGQDIQTPLGTSLYSHVSGKVISARYNSVTGRTVVIRGTDGRLYYFGHLSAFGVTPGQSVGPSTFLGKTGGARNDPWRGDATGPHLWFGVSENGHLVNPRAYINQGLMFGGSGGTTVASTDPNGPAAGSLPGSNGESLDPTSNFSTPAGVVVEPHTEDIQAATDKVLGRLSSAADVLGLDPDGKDSLTQTVFAADEHTKALEASARALAGASLPLLPYLLRKAL